MKKTLIVIFTVLLCLLNSCVNNNNDENNDENIQVETYEDGKLFWECPQCGNRDQNKLNVARRTCGYIGSHYWNQGRTQEIKDRVLHL